MRRASCLAGATLVALAFAPPARADLNKLRTEVTDLEQAARNLSVRYATQVGTEQIAEHRLVDAQVLYTLRDYTRAAILLFDYVAKYKHTRGYPEAVFYLADSLYQKRDFLSAKRYFQLIVNEVRGKYYQEALQRLVELSLRTGDVSEVQGYLNALSAIPQHQLQPSVPYVRGKYFYFRGQLDEGLAAFRSIPSGAKYYLHGQYFVGAALVQRKDYAGAMAVYSALLKLEPKGDGERHIRDLTYLALGRLLYEKGEINPAIDMYQKVSRKSPEFDTSLYEICWVYIKAAQQKHPTQNYQKALRALDLLVLAHPDSPTIPDVKVLQGNLLMRLEQWGRATDLFTKTREKFVPIQARMKQVLAEHSDPNVFFDVLLARNIGSLGVQVQVPELAASWVKESPNVRRALNLVRDVRDIQASIKEAQDLIVRLERAVNTPAKIKIFPEFAAAKTSALEVENRLLLARRELLESELALVSGLATGAEKDQLSRLAATRAALEKKVRELPTTAAGYSEREKGKLEKIAQLEKEISKLSVLVDSLRAQLVAAEKFFQDTQAGSAKKDLRDRFKREVDGVRAMVNGLGSEVDELRQALADSKAHVGVGGSEELAERGVKAQYRNAIAQEHRLLATLRNRLDASKGGEFDTLSGLLGRCSSIDTTLEAFDKKLDRGIEEKLSSIRTALREEKEAVKRYQTESAEYGAQTSKVAGAITYDGFKQVAHRFYEIIVTADVGIIDVAWALKDSKSKEVSRLVRQQKLDLKVLDEEFKEVLQED
jgi:tetratricopeptide (TPR) repeat protein